MPRLAFPRPTLATLAAGLLLVPLVAACGGGGEKGGSYEDYVSGFCAAQLKANQQIEPLMTGVNASNITPDTLKKMGAIYAVFATDLAKLDPPARIAGFHKDWTAAWERAAKQMKTGDTTVDPFLELEQMAMPSENETVDLRTAAKKDADCIAAGITFEEE